MNKETNSNGSRVKKFFIASLFLLLIYSNLWVLLARSPLMSESRDLNPWVSEVKVSFLPFSFFQSKALVDLFDTFSVFAYYETINRDFFVLGYSEETGEWSDLAVIEEYFPHYLGEQQMRLFLAKHFSNLSKEEYQEALKSFVGKIRAKYNREHPEEKVNKVALSYSVWPRSAKAYRALKLPETTSEYTLYKER